MTTVGSDEVGSLLRTLPSTPDDPAHVLQDLQADTEAVSESTQVDRDSRGGQEDDDDDAECSEPCPVLDRLAGQVAI